MVFKKYIPNIGNVYGAGDYYVNYKRSWERHGNSYIGYFAKWSFTKGRLVGESKWHSNEGDVENNRQVNNQLRISINGKPVTNWVEYNAFRTYVATFSNNNNNNNLAGNV